MEVYKEKLWSLTVLQRQFFGYTVFQKVTRSNSGQPLGTRFHKVSSGAYLAGRVAYLSILVLSFPLTIFFPGPALCWVLGFDIFLLRCYTQGIGVQEEPGSFMFIIEPHVPSTSVPSGRGKGTVVQHSFTRATS